MNEEEKDHLEGHLTTNNSKGTQKGIEPRTDHSLRCVMSPDKQELIKYIGMVAENTRKRMQKSPRRSNITLRTSTILSEQSSECRGQLHWKMKKRHDTETCPEL